MLIFIDAMKLIGIFSGESKSSQYSVFCACIDDKEKYLVMWERVTSNSNMNCCLPDDNISKISLDKKDRTTVLRRLDRQW